MFIVPFVISQLLFTTPEPVIPFTNLHAAQIAGWDFEGGPRTINLNSAMTPYYTGYNTTYIPVNKSLWVCPVGGFATRYELEHSCKYHNGLNNIEVNTGHVFET